MRRLFLAASIYLGLGLASGVVYREITKAADFTGVTQLSVVHTHLLTLGFLVSLLLLALDKLFILSAHKLFTVGFWHYNVGVVLATGIMVWHGVLQVQGETGGGMIAGIAGLGHILITVGLVMFMVVLGRTVRVAQAERKAAAAA